MPQQKVNAVMLIRNDQAYNLRSRRIFRAMVGESMTRAYRNQCTFKLACVNGISNHIDDSQWLRDGDTLHIVYNKKEA